MADFFQWDPGQLSVKVKAMDDEHVVLIQKMNALHAAFVRKAEPSELSPMISDFVAYAEKHFADEEAYMASINYAGIEAHKAKHKQLLDQVRANVNLFESSGELSPSFFHLLSLWLNSHIQGVDKEYGKFAAKAA
jgi:hemerythrin